MLLYRFRLAWSLLPLLLAAPALAGSASAPSVVDLSQEPTLTQEGEVTRTEDTQRYGIYVKGDNVRVEIRINDVPVFFRILRNNEVLDTTYNEWIRNGLNVVSLHMERFDEKRPYELSYNLYYQSPTQIVNGERSMIYASKDEVLLPLRQPIGVRTQSVPSLRIWLTEEVVLGDDEKQRLVDVVNSQRARLIDAMASADNTYLATFEKPLRDQLDIAYGRIPEDSAAVLERRKAIVEKFSSLLNASVQASPALGMGDLNFELVGDSRLVRLTRIDGSPLIEVRRGDMVHTIERPFYGSIAGVWERLR